MQSVFSAALHRLKAQLPLHCFAHCIALVVMLNQRAVPATCRKLTTCVCLVWSDHYSFHSQSLGSTSHGSWTADSFATTSIIVLMQHTFQSRSGLVLALSLTEIWVFALAHDNVWQYNSHNLWFVCMGSKTTICTSTWDRSRSVFC